MRQSIYQRLMRKTGVALLCALGLSALPAQEVRASDYQVISENTVHIPLLIGELLLTETVVQDGPQAINRFTMHRLRRPQFPHRGTLLLLPPLGNNFHTYTFSESGDITKSFAAFFARLGYEMWGYSPRETGIHAGDCGGLLDCTAVLDWSLQTIINDVTFIRSQIASVFPGELPAVGGLSLGAAAALAVVNQGPGEYAGLLAWEGSLFTADPVIRAHNQEFCNQFTALVAAGIPVDDQALPFVKLVAQLAQLAPNDPFALPVPDFPPGLTNRQAFIFILSTPNPFAPSPRPGFISAVAAGSFPSNQLLFSDINRLSANIATFNDVTSNRLVRDLYCSLAGVETTYTANLANMTAPVMVIKGGQGFGTIMDELPGQLGSTAVTFYGLNAFAHVDHLGSPLHQVILELPIALWLHKAVFP